MSQREEHRLEASLSRLLTAGTSVAGLVMLTGTAWVVLASPGAARPRYEQFVPTAEQGKGLGAIVQSVLRLEPHAIMLAGVLLLVLTPIVRVIFTLAAFALRRDWLYVLLTALVAGVLVYGLLGGTVH